MFLEAKASYRAGEEMVVAEFDLTNAFGRMRRSAVLKSVIEHAPAAAAFFAGLWGASAAKVILVDRAVRQ